MLELDEVLSERASVVLRVSGGSIGTALNATVWSTGKGLIGTAIHEVGHYCQLRDKVVTHAFGFLELL